MRLRIIALLVCWALLRSAAPLRAEESAAKPSASLGPEEMIARFGDAGWLRVHVKHVRPPNDQTLVIRADVTNPYEEETEGIRMVVRILARGEERRELDRRIVEFGMRLDPGQKKSFTKEIPTGYAKKLGNLQVVGFAMTRAGKEIPEPSDEIIVTAADETEVNFATEIPYPSSPVSVDSAY